MSKGYFTIAQNSNDDYVKFAYALALSLKASQKEVSNLSIAVTPGTKIADKYLSVFDKIIEIPWSDDAENSDWKLENEWKTFYMSPYDETIKLDADMLFLNDVSNWWRKLADIEVNIASMVKTYHGTIATSTFYRQAFVANKLPNVYSAAFYFKKCNTSRILFEKLNEITANWEVYSRLCIPLHRPDKFNTDVGLALAVKLLWYDEFCLYPQIMSFVHMKSQLQDWHQVGRIDFPWTRFVPHYFTDKLELKIGNIKQNGIFHYYCKQFLTDSIIQKYERYLGI